jgi:hypothetical protein
MPSPYRREELIADTATLVYLLSGREELIADTATLVDIPSLCKKRSHPGLLGGRSHGHFPQMCQLNEIYYHGKIVAVSGRKVAVKVTKMLNCSRCSGSAKMVAVVAAENYS